MIRDIHNILSNNSYIKKNIFKGSFGLEKENVRVNSNGDLSLAPHPKALGDKTTHPYITTDFSESQIEMITPPSKSIDEAYYFMENLHDIVSLNIGDEYLWPQSIPPVLPEENKIPIARYDESEKGREAEEYREMLAKKYGKRKQLISGIHYNFSFDDDFLLELKRVIGDERPFKEYRDDIYMKISRNLLKYNWFLVYMFGASIGSHESYSKICNNKMIEGKDGTYYFPYATSFRNGPCGYKNLKDYMISYKSVADYVEDIKSLVEVGEISSAKEYYSSVRLKSTIGGDILKTLPESGVDYLELRFIDLNPFKKVGIERKTLYFLHLFLIYCMISEDRDYTEKLKKEDDYNTMIASSVGRQGETELLRCGEKVNIVEWKLEIVDELEELIKLLVPRKEEYKKSLEEIRKRIIDRSLSERLAEEFDREGYLKFHMDRAKEYLKRSKAKEYNLKSYEDLELSSQILIKEAIRRGIKVSVLDRKENFIELEKDGHVEYIKQATKTSLDSYSTVLVMENKLITKKVLEKNSIKVPEGNSYIDIDEALDDYDLYKEGRCVIKPNNTNFGIGITIFKDEMDRENYEKAVRLAFENDATILIEKFVEGKEYRFFVIGDEVVGILHRVPANVVGDGKCSIRELVEEKNKDPLRGKGYKTPLEKINLGVPEEMFLSAQGLDFDSIIEKDEIVYLRENSNISTGGDSIDFTDDINIEYKKIAVKASKAVGATICGVDMMLKDIKEYKEESYSIIELNFNPAIHIHCYPYIGKNRRLGEKLLDILNF